MRFQWSIQFSVSYLYIFLEAQTVEAGTSYN